MVKYDVAHATLSMKDMIKKVNEATKEGWKPLGGVCVDSGYGWSQAMTSDGK